MDLVIEKHACLACSASARLPDLQEKEMSNFCDILLCDESVRGDVRRRRCTINPHLWRTGWSVTMSVPVRLLGESMFYSQFMFTSLGFDVDEDGPSAGR